MKYGLPIEFDILKDGLKEDDWIDMHDLNFPKLNAKQQIAASFIFTRNMNIAGDKLHFIECTYEERAEYIMLYMTSRISINIPILNTTILDILSNSENIGSESILNRQEIEKFIEEHVEFLNKTMEVIKSIPICAINFFFKGKKNLFFNYNEDEDNYIEGIETDYWDGLNYELLDRLMDYNEFIYLVVISDRNFTPKYFIKYFTIANDNPVFNKLLKKLPFLSMLNLIFNDKGGNNKESFINNINEALKSNDEIIPLTEDE